MSLTNQINQDIKAAMLAKEKEKLEALRAIKAALLLEATKDGSEVTEEAEGKILQKLYKQRVESHKIYIEQNRSDLAEVEQAQANIIKIYLPAQMSEEEINKVVTEVISQMGATGPSDMGKIMGASMKKLQGKADGNLISGVVRKLLSEL